MRNKIFYSITIATILLFGSCNNELSIPETEIESPRTISLTASMPEDEPTTRVDLNKIEKNIELTWNVNDEIQVVFVQGANKLKQKALVNSTSLDKKTAYFDINIPSLLTTGTYDLYGVYGGNGLSDENPTNAILPRGPFNANSLNIGNSSIESRKDVMLFFSYKNIPASSPQKSVNFKHIGSIFTIVINDVNPTIADYFKNLNIYQTRLIGVENDDKKWAFNSIKCGQIYDLIKNKFYWLENANNYIHFNRSTPGLSEGNLILWGWYPMIGKVWPELRFVMVNSKEEILLATTNTKAKKTSAPVAGKTYYFYIGHDNTLPPATKFYFSDAAFKPLP